MVDVERIESRLGMLERGHLTPELGASLAAAARQRNLLVHAYMDVDDRLIFASLSRLDDLREFAAAAQRLASADR